MYDLFAVIALGSLVGAISIRGLSLGSAGVLLVAFIFGYYGRVTPSAVTDLGILLFVFSIGLQVGARFFRRFFQSPFLYILIGIIPIAISAIVAIALGYCFQVQPTLTIGSFAGAMTSTPALVAALDAIGINDRDGQSLVTLGFGLAYPFGMLGIGLSVVLFTNLFAKRLTADAEKLRKTDSSVSTLVVKHYRVLNENCFGQRIRDLGIRTLTNANISRVTRAGGIVCVFPDFTLEKDDIVSAVVRPDKSQALAVLLGPEVSHSSELGDQLITKDIEVSSPDITKANLASLRFFEKYSVSVTRVRRTDIEFAPDAQTILELGDQIRIIGEKGRVENVAKILGINSQRIQETAMVPFLAGILLGIVIGSIPVTIGNSIDLKLGHAGGCFVVSLALGFFGRLGPLRLYVPQAARNICRDLGLILFLAGTGSASGAQFLDAVEKGGLAVIGIGAATTVTLMFSSLFITYLLLKKTFLESTGYLCGTANNSLAIHQICEKSSSDLAALTYATIYPISLIGKVIAVQVCMRFLKL